MMIKGIGENYDLTFFKQHIIEGEIPHFSDSVASNAIVISRSIASKLNAKEVIMTDIDECAIVATEHNLKVNNVKNGTVLLKNLLDDNSVKGDIIVCNIMAEVLIYFAPHIGKNLKENGVIILSGILTDRMDKVITAYTENGFKFVEKTIKGEWSALVFTK